jgi:ADP-ribosylglycohydrolase
MEKPVHDLLIGTAIGDALGVPVEFKERRVLEADPVQEMRGFGSHNQPPGTWSDDSSLTFCLAESLCKGYDLKDLARKFTAWYREGYWAAHGRVFDVGIATSRSISRLERGVVPVLAGGANESENGNGSLMRIAPLAFYVRSEKIEQRYKLVNEVSSLTHRHIRSVLACFILIEFIIQLLESKDKFRAFDATKQIVNDFLNSNPICSEYEINQFKRLLLDSEPLYECPVSQIHSSGYVVDTLEASLWCLLNEDTFEKTVLKAVNLGEDTDTVGAVTGGLAGLLYGMESIPEKWMAQLARKEDILNLAERLGKKCKIK